MLIINYAYFTETMFASCFYLLLALCIFYRHTPYDRFCTCILPGFQVFEKQLIGMKRMIWKFTKQCNPAFKVTFALHFVRFWQPSKKK